MARIHWPVRTAPSWPPRRRRHRVAIASGFGIVAAVAAAPTAARAQLNFGCPSYITIVESPAPNHYQTTTGTVRVQFGEGTRPKCISMDRTQDPATFQLTVNGVDVTSYFSFTLGEATATGLPLVDHSTNTLVATITGWDAASVPRTDMAVAYTGVRSVLRPGAGAVHPTGPD